MAPACFVKKGVPVNISDIFRDAGSSKLSLWLCLYKKRQAYWAKTLYTDFQPHTFLQKV